MAETPNSHISACLASLSARASLGTPASACRREGGKETPGGAASDGTEVTRELTGIRQIPQEEASVRHVRDP